MTVLYFAQREKLLHRIEHFEFLHLICDKNHIVREEEIDESYYKLLQEIQERLRKDGKDIDLELVGKIDIVLFSVFVLIQGGMVYMECISLLAFKSLCT